MRRLRGRSSGDGVSPKRPRLLPVASLFHIVAPADWPIRGDYRPRSLAAHGFVHLSFADQVDGVINVQNFAGKTKLREAKDRLSEADYLVGYFYYRQRWWPGAVDRFKSVLKDDPSYTGRDALYYYLAESLVKLKREAEALPLLEKLVQEFEKSEYLAEAQKRITELKTQAQTKASGG